mgnify:CR=1 FL=1
MKFKISFARFLIDNFCADKKAPSDNFFLSISSSFIFFIEAAISSTFIGSTKIEFSAFKISALKGLSDEIIGKPHAIASIIALEHPSLSVGRTNTSHAFKYKLISSWGTRPLNKIPSQPGYNCPEPIKTDLTP